MAPPLRRPGLHTLRLPHCIADAFYIECCRTDYLAANLGALIPFYAAIVVGNFLGCNLYRLADRRSATSPPGSATSPTTTTDPLPKSIPNTL